MLNFVLRGSPLTRKSEYPIVSRTSCFNPKALYKSTIKIQNGDHR